MAQVLHFVLYHLIDSIAIAVQRCTGMAQQASVVMEARMALEAAA